MILIFLAVDWPVFSRRPMVKALAKASEKYGAKVVAVNRPLCPLSTAIRKPGRFRELFFRARLESIAENLWLYSPKYFLHDQITSRVGVLERLNLMALRRSFRYLSRKLGVLETAPLIWYYYPQQGYVTSLFSDSFCIYEIYDSLADIWGMPQPDVDHLEAKWRTEVDLLLTTSRRLYSKHSQDYKHAFPFGNGIDQEAFHKYGNENVKPLPEIAKIPAPRIGYAGNISERLDWELIEEMASLRPDWSFVFVGNVVASKSTHKIQRLPNVYFVRAYPQEAMPAITKAFQVGMLPYRENAFFEYLNPLKFYENLAAGIPSVSSPIDELRQHPPEAVRVISNDAAEWIETIESLLTSDNKMARQVRSTIARKYLWEEMSAAVLRVIGSVMRQI